MLSIRGVVIPFISLAFCLGAPQAHAGPDRTDFLGALFYIEIVADVCGVEFGEARETDLDNAQHEARLSANLSYREASAVYRGVRLRVSSERDEICRVDLQQDLEALLQRTLLGAG